LLCGERRRADRQPVPLLPTRSPRSSSRPADRQPSSAERTSVKRSPPGPLRKRVGAALCVSAGATRVAWPNNADVQAASAVAASTATRQTPGHRERTRVLHDRLLSKGPAGLPKPTCLSYARRSISTCTRTGIPKKH
jgi:hypothetical protein